LAKKKAQVNMKRKLLWLGFILLISACYPKEDRILRDSIHDTEEAYYWQTVTAMPSPTPTPTRIPRPIDPYQLTAIPAGTNIPEPIYLSGSGDSVVKLEKWSGPAIATISYSGATTPSPNGDFFLVYNYDSSENRLDLYVHANDAYIGTVPIDFRDWEQTASFKVKADGAWEIIVYPITYVRSVQIPGMFSGSGDDVVFIHGGIPDKIRVDAPAIGDSLSIWALTDTGMHGLCAVSTPYRDAGVIDESTTILTVSTGGSWTIEILTK
jgi:hypothetical protein